MSEPKKRKGTKPGDVYYYRLENSGAGWGGELAVPTATNPPADTATPEPTATATATPSLADELGGEIAQVTNVVDGDTIDVRVGDETYRVRFIGMDTPERGDPLFSEATEAARQLVG